MLYVCRYLCMYSIYAYAVHMYVRMYVLTNVCVRIGLSDMFLCYLFLEYLHTYVCMHVLYMVG